MIYRPWYALAMIALFVALVIGGKTCLNHYDAKAETAIVESTRLKGETDALKKQAAIASTQANTYADQAANLAKETAALKAKLVKLQAIHPDPMAPTVPGTVVSNDNSPIETADSIKDQIIIKQDEQIVSLGGEVDSLRASLTLTQSALESSEKRARGLEIAIDAMKHAEKTAKWQGRFQGFAVGVAVGYIGGVVK